VPSHMELLILMFLQTVSPVLQIPERVAAVKRSSWFFIGQPNLLRAHSVREQPPSVFFKVLDRATSPVSSADLRSDRQLPWYNSFRPGRRIGQRWEPTRAPTQGPRPKGRHNVPPCLFPPSGLALKR
jgi:hypothetical protein